MTSIIRATSEDYQLLTELGKTSFIESHSSSALAEDINNYVAAKYTWDILKQELADCNNIYHIIFYKGQPAGYSKIILNVPYNEIAPANFTKMERLYLLQEFYDLTLGYELLQFNIGLSKANEQAGMWLYTWKGNDRAVEFYTRAGFEVIGSHDFKISENHANPNHQMLLRY